MKFILTMQFKSQRNSAFYATSELFSTYSQFMINQLIHCILIDIFSAINSSKNTHCKGSGNRQAEFVKNINPTAELES